jgi:hypothetical protein
MSLCALHACITYDVYGEEREVHAMMASLACWLQLVGVWLVWLRLKMCGYKLSSIYILLYGMLSTLMPKS